MIDTEAILVAELERLAPVGQVPLPDWESLLKATTPQTLRLLRRRTLIVAFVAALLLVGAATATLLATRGEAPKPRARHYNGPLTVNAKGAVAALDGSGRVTPVWTCPREHGCGILNGIAWSRDGRWLAYARPRWARDRSTDGLYVVDLGTRRQWHIAPSLVGCNIPADLEWSPDGRRIAYTCPSRIFLIDRGLTRRSELRTEPVAGRLSSPTWSADGRLLAFAARVGSNLQGHSAVYVANLAGGSIRQLATRATAPAWSPDGGVIAVRTSCGGVELLTPDGRTVTPGPHAPRCRAMGVPGIPVWSPDGRKLAIQMRPRGGVYVIDRSGTHLAVIAARGTAGDTGGGAFGGDRPAWRPTSTPPARSPATSSDL